MVPLVLLALVAVALVVTVLAVANGRVPADPLADAVHTTPDTGLPAEPVAADVAGVRFDTALRGYRIEEVDARLDDLRDTLAERERTLAELGGALPEAAATTVCEPAGDLRRVHTRSQGESDERVEPGEPVERTRPAGAVDVPREG